LSPLQNQNEETPAVYHLKDTSTTTASPGQYSSKETLSPAAAAIVAGSSQLAAATAAGSSSGGRLGSRLTKSASWFNSLSRRRVSSTGGCGSGGKPPIKKRSFAAFNASHRAADDSFATPSRPRLNK
jgi:hypothetical protein